jgi:hypothetical protein
LKIRLADLEQGFFYAVSLYGFSMGYFCPKSGAVIVNSSFKVVNSDGHMINLG